MNYEVYHIPTNFTDAGRVMGLFELRNLVEAVLLTLPALYLCIQFQQAQILVAEAAVLFQFHQRNAAFLPYIA